MKIAAYTASGAAVWNEFVAQAKNGTFLHDRRYMDYHADRFPDRSLLVHDRDKLFAVLPACAQGEEIVSHAGLTYGGLLLRPEARLPQVLDAFHAVLRHCTQLGFRRFVYKQVPSFHHKRLCHEDEYALFLAGATLVRRETTLLVDQADRLPFQERRERSAKKAAKAGVTCRRSTEFGAYWREVLVPNLKARFGADPVHSLEEIERLARAFPDCIRLHVAEREGRTVAGAVVYASERVVHTQYISANEEGKEIGALDLLFRQLIDEVYRERRYFSFGTSNQDQGKAINLGLVEWKEGFGARASSNDTWSVSLDGDYPLLSPYAT